MKKRKCLRFPLNTEVFFGKENQQAVLKDFSRFGMRMISSTFNYPPQTLLELKLKRPFSNSFIPITAEVKWISFSGEYYEIGLYFKEIPSLIKAELLDCAYQTWIKNKIS